MGNGLLLRQVEIIVRKEFEPDLKGNVLTVRLKAADDSESTIRMTLRAGGGEE